MAFCKENSPTDSGTKCFKTETTIKCDKIAFKINFLVHKVRV